MMSRDYPGVRLTAAETALLAGEQGPGARMAMRIVARMAAAQGATHLLSVDAAHIDGCTYQGDAMLEFVERLRDGGARVAVPSTMNAVSLDLRPEARGLLPEAWTGPARRIVDAYLAMGCAPTFSCAPYQLPAIEALSPGQHVAFGESNVIGFVNSVRGLRTERYGDFMDIAAAVVGRVPALGLHLPANRRATQVLVLGEEVPQALVERDDFWPVLGYVIGLWSESRIAVVEGLPTDPPPSTDALKALYAAAASSGAVALCHLAGITPEAPTTAAALDGAAPQSTRVIRLQDLNAARQGLKTLAVGDPVDVVALGSPHFSGMEFRALARLVRGRRIAEGTRLVITTNQVARLQADHEGLLTEIEGFGAEVVTDTCILLAPLLPTATRTLMTNSAKYAHYAPGLLDVRVASGSLAVCVEAAVTGRVPRDEEGERLWNP